MKKLTYGCSMAIMVLASQRMGLETSYAESARTLLSGGVLHATAGAELESEAVRLNEQVRHDDSLITKANLHVEHLCVEFGFSDEMSKNAFLALQEEAEALELAAAQGRDLPSQLDRLKLIDETMSKVQWTLHPDHGCVLKSQVSELDLDVESRAM